MNLAIAATDATDFKPGGRWQHACRFPAILGFLWGWTSVMGSGRVVSAEGWRDGGGSVRLLAQLGDCYEQRREAGMAWGKPEVLHWENLRWRVVMSLGKNRLISINLRGLWNWSASTFVLDTVLSGIFVGPKLTASGMQCPYWLGGPLLSHHLLRDKP